MSLAESSIVGVSPATTASATKNPTAAIPASGANRSRRSIAHLRCRFPPPSDYHRGRQRSMIISNRTSRLADESNYVQYDGSRCFSWRMTIIVTGMTISSTAHLKTNPTTK